jgi:RNA polymerase sigma factor (sigma-70 family)
LSRQASVLPNREHESNIGEYRVAQGKTIKDLVEKTGVDQSAISSLQNGMTAPIYLVGKRAGQVKPWVEKICQELNASVADLFPRYFCRIDPYIGHYLTTHQMSGVSIGDYVDISQYDALEQVELEKIVAQILASLPSEEETIIRERIFEEKTIRDIGENLNLTPSRIRQIEAQALRKLRHYTRSRKLKEFYVS